MPHAKREGSPTFTSTGMLIVMAFALVSGGYIADDGTIPFWVEVSAYTMIALGTIWGGWRIIETMGLRITRLNANSGVAANIGATSAIVGATELGIPISTTQAAAASVVDALRQGT